MARNFDLMAIPKTHRIFFHTMDVAGTHKRKRAIREANDYWITGMELVSEPTNKYDQNAIKIILIKKGWFFTKRFDVGYVPKEFAAYIAKKKLIDDLIPRLRHLWVGDVGGVAVLFDLLGPKDRYNEIID